MWSVSTSANRAGRMTATFSTYQSLDVVARAQREFGLPAFDLIVCDEAHRTTGVSLAGRNESGFQRIHDNEFIAGRKRLYMTATPRIYGDRAKRKANESQLTIASMDDESQYGPEFTGSALAKPSSWASSRHTKSSSSTWTKNRSAWT